MAMAVDHDVREADSDAEDVDAEDVKEPSRPPDRRPPRDDPGAEAEGIVSRADSRAGTNAANEMSGRSGITESSESAGEAVADATARSLPVGEHGHDGSGERLRSSHRQRALGEHLAEVADQKVDQEIDQTLDKVNPQEAVTGSMSRTSAAKSALSMGSRRLRFPMPLTTSPWVTTLGTFGSMT
ncbi:MAG TPA: hypothetical protein VE198_10935 [Actinoallomurus sp.]|nr:hypothetical protein [Actinoallomurus sp.]